MKIERWNKELERFEVVELNDEEFEEMLICLKIAEAEAQIEERMELVRLEAYEQIPIYD